MNPNFFIVGAPKSATTNMSYYLMQHPEIFMPQNLEPYYFARQDIPKNYERGIISDKKKYLSLFKKAVNKKAVGESSPVYLYCPHSATDIKNNFPDSKIIISLRNPIEITWSQYFSLKFMNFDKKRSFNEILDINEEEYKREEFNIDSLIEAGFYSKHIKRFQENFSNNQIKIVIFEEYIKNITSTMNSILSFLEIDKSIDFEESPKGAYKIPKNSLVKRFLENSTFRKTAQLIIPTVTRQKFGERFLLNETQKEPINNTDRKRLKRIFEKDVKDLEHMLGRKFPWDDFN